MARTLPTRVGWELTVLVLVVILTLTFIFLPVRFRLKTTWWKWFGS